MLFSRAIMKIRINHNWIYIILFSLLWSVGLVAGRYLSQKAFLVFPTVFRSACSESTSLIGLIAVVFIPLFTSLLVCRYISVMLIFPIVFLKAVGFGFCSYAICLSFGDAGWLVRYLLMFTDCVSIPLLLWFWVRRLLMRNNAIMQDFTLALFLLILTAYIDHLYVSPFLALLIN